MSSMTRIALLTGASAAALGMSHPAFAATTPGVGSTTVGLNAINTLPISLVTDPNFVTGTANSGTGVVTATTTGGVPGGQIIQQGNATGVPPIAGNVVLTATNGGSVQVCYTAQGFVLVELTFQMAGQDSASKSGEKTEKNGAPGWI